MKRITTQEIVIPAVTFGVKVRLSEGGLTPIERVAIEAIGHGVQDVSLLGTLLGLGQRPALDLLYDLWRAGYLVVGAERGKVRLIGPALTHFRAGTLDALESAERNLRTVHLLQELLTGAVLPWLGTTRPAGADSAIVPTPRSALDLSGVTKAELSDAVERELERERRRSKATDANDVRALKLVETWVEPDQLMLVPSADAPQVQSRRFLTVYADVWIDTNSQRMMFELVHAPDLPPTLRRALSRALGQRAERDAGLVFYKRLRQELERRAHQDAPRAGRDTISRFVEESARLDHVDAGTVGQRHQTLRALWLDAQDVLAERQSAQAQTELLVGYEAHDAALRTLASAAQRQLVLANPWISLDGLISEAGGVSWLSLLTTLLHRGVRVVLLWGISEDAQLPPEVKNALEDLRARFPSLFLRSVHSANLHAKVAVRDAAEAIVTSYNFLQPPRNGDSLELGVRVWGETETRCPGVVSRLLDWARRCYPEHLARAQVNITPDELGAALQPPLALPDEPALPEVNTDNLEQRAVGLRLWAEEWRTLAVQAQTLAEQLGEGVTLIEGGEHKTRLWHALAECRSRLVVLSDQLSVDVVNDRFVGALQSRLDADVPCTFMFRREGATDSEDGPTARLLRLAKANPTLVRVAPARSHAKVLIADDHLTLGSFNFLSYIGETGGSRGRAERAELSVQLSGPSLVDRLLEELDGLAPGVFSPLVGRSVTTADRGELSTPRALQPLVEALHDDGPASLRAWFKRSNDPWGELDALRRARLAAPLLHRATLAALAYASDERSPARDRWRVSAALSRWVLGDLVGAALLLPEAPPADATLRPELAKLGAQAQANDGASLTLFEPRDEDEAAAMLALSLPTALLQGRWELIQPLHDSAPRLPGELRRWPTALQEYQRAGQGQPLNVALLARHASEAERRGIALTAYLQLGDALARAAQVGFLFPVGQHAWGRLRASGGFLGELEAAHAARDAQRLGAYLRRLDETRRTPEQLMDEASVLSKDAHGNDKIEFSKRESCLTRLNRAHIAARAWVEAEVAIQMTPEDTRALNSARALARALVELSSPSLLTRLTLASPALALARARLHPLLTLERQ